MNHSAHNKLISFIWSIADDCLRDVYVRGKYRDVILPMVVLRRLDTLLEPSKQAVLNEVKFQKEEMDAILSERKKLWTPRAPRYESGVLKIYSEHAVSPMKGGYMK